MTSDKNEKTDSVSYNIESTLSPECVLDHDKIWVEACIFSPDGSILSTCSAEAVWLWDMSSGRHLGKLNHDTTVWKSKFTPNGKKLCTVTSGGSLYIWLINEFELQAKIRVHETCAFGCAVHPNGNIVATGGFDGNIKLYDINQNRAIASFNNHRDSVEDVSFASSGNMLASCSKDKTIRLWTNYTSVSPNHKVLRNHKKWVLSCVFFCNDRFLATASADKMIGIWFVEYITEAKLLRFIKGHQNVIWNCSVLGDNILVSASSDRTLRFWDGMSGRELHCERDLGGVSDGRGQVLSCCASTKSLPMLLAATSYTGYAYVYRINMDRLLGQIKMVSK